MAEVNLNLDYPSNSNKNKKEMTEKKINPVVQNDEIRIRKKGFFGRFKKSMVSDDVGNIGDYVLKDIIVPMLKDLIFDSIKGSLEIALWGNTSKKRRRNGSVPYNSLNDGSTFRYNGITNAKESSERKKPIDYFDIESIEFKTKKAAEDTLSDLRMVLDDYPSVTVSELYEFLGVTAPHTTNNYGWTDLSNADVGHYKGWYHLILPEPKIIKK